MPFFSQIFKVQRETPPIFFRNDSPFFLISTLSSASHSLGTYLRCYFPTKARAERDSTRTLCTVAYIITADCDGMRWLARGVALVKLL